MRSIFTGFNEFTNLVQTNEFDIVGVTESWLNNRTSSDDVSIPGYKLYRKDRGTGRGGGIGIYVKSHLKCDMIPFVNSPVVIGFENLWIRVKLCNKVTMAVGVMYRTGNNVLDCVNVLDALLPQILPMDNYIVAFGDLNINMLNIVNPVNQLFDSYGFLQIIDEPTRVTDRSATLLDPIFVNTKDIVVSSGIIDTSVISDHMMTFCNIDIPLNTRIPKFVTFRDFKTFNEHDFLNDVASIPWDNIYYFYDIEDKISFLTDNLNSLFGIHAPFRTVRVNKPHAPWLTVAVKSLMKERDKARIRARLENTAESFEIYKNLRNVVKAAIRREKTAYLSHVSNQKNQRQLWKTLQDFNVYSSKTSSNIDLPPEFLNADTINDNFCSVFQKTHNCDNKIRFYSNNKYNVDISFSFRLVSQIDIFRCIQSIKSNAAGHDDLTLLMIRLCLPTLINHVTNIINSCLERGYFPQCWKKSVVTPIPKTKNPVNINDLRPISLLPVLSKVLERVVHAQIFEYLKQNNLIPVHQSGFIEGHSTTSALLNITDNITRTLDEKVAAILVLLDYSKAFDVIDHNLMCSKLSYYGFDEISTCFFNFYLTNRFQAVRTKNGTSQSRAVVSGVPQGSILGPLLFVIYTADIFSVVSNTHLQTYADDTQLLLKFDPSNPERAAALLNNDLEAILQYSREHNLKINPNKTEALLFCAEKQRNILKNRLQSLILIGNSSLEFSNCAKNLGLYLDVNLRFYKHVQSLLQRSYVKMKLLYSNRYLLNFKMRKKLCEAFVMSIYNYCYIVYYPFLDLITKKRIQYVQNTCCRFIFNLRKYDSVSNNIKQIGWLRCDNMYKFYSMIFFRKLLESKQPLYLFQKLEFRSNAHNLNLRDRNYLSIPKHRTSLFQRCFSYSFVKLYNTIPLKFRQYSVGKLRVDYKNLLLN